MYFSLHFNKLFGERTNDSQRICFMADTPRVRATNVSYGLHLCADFHSQLIPIVNSSFDHDDEVTRTIRGARIMVANGGHRTSALRIALTTTCITIAISHRHRDNHRRYTADTKNELEHDHLVHIAQRSDTIIK